MSEEFRCIDPRVVQEEDYLAYLDQQARPEFSAHLEHCPFCLREIQIYTNLSGLLHQNLKFETSLERKGCFKTLVLGEYAAGLLSQTEAGRVEAHLNSCAFCGEEVASFRAWLPEPGLPALASVFQTGTPVQRETTSPGWIRRVVASLVESISPAPGLALAGLRGSSADFPQVFQAEELNITLFVHPEGPRSSRLVIEGLVQAGDLTGEAGETLKGAGIRLILGGEIVGVSEVDSEGNFTLEDLPASPNYDLELTLPAKIVLVPDIHGIETQANP